MESNAIFTWPARQPERSCRNSTSTLNPQAGPVAKQHAHAHAHEQATGHGGKSGGNLTESDPLRYPLGKHRQQRHRCKGFECEHQAHALISQAVKRERAKNTKLKFQPVA